MSEFVSREDFEKTMNTGYTAYFNEGVATPLTLIEITETRIRRDYENFSLIFRGPVNGPLRQLTLDVEHPDLGMLCMSLVPVAQDNDGLQYEAVFNRKMKQETAED